MERNLKPQIMKVRHVVTLLFTHQINSMSLWNAINDSGIYRGYYEEDIGIIFLTEGAIRNLLFKNLKPNDGRFGYAFPDVIGTMAGIYLCWIHKYHKTYEEISAKITKSDLGEAATFHRGMNFDLCLERANEQFKDVLEAL